MLVSDLIALLQDMPQEVPVTLVDLAGYWTNIDKVVLAENDNVVEIRSSED